MELVPSIISQTFSGVEDKLQLLEGQVNWAHLDIMDGRFAKIRSWQVASDLDFISGQIKLEAHLMVEKPEEIISAWAQVVDRVIVHAEAAADIKELIAVFSNHHTQLGVALLLETPVEVLTKYLSVLKFVHLMSVAEIGYHGKKFESKVLAKIKTLRALAPSVTISVDGGINLENIKKVLAAGADRVVVGGTIWNSPDPIKTIHQFQKLFHVK
ncbi:MAG: HisA/HisF-related TIM barrel protein [bacterium]|nr:HisA/HisF-related TIM barrel protein [bacterium]